MVLLELALCLCCLDQVLQADALLTKIISTNVF
ncbi:hypothetical protein sync_1084 [Synechococcus sp. CC9311]|nr:hypothetical protein sync_1084 [Synechococcus sp. CC9311]